MVLSASTTLQGEVARIAAAAAVELRVATTVAQARAGWGEVSAVLLGSDMPEEVAGWAGPLLVVGTTAELTGMWLQAARLGADRVAALPESAPWLADYLAHLREPRGGPGLLGFVGGCGGAGASTCAAVVAAGAAARGLGVLLVDGDPWGGALEVALGCSTVPGLRWPDVLQASGPLNPEQLAQALPRSAGCAVLSWGAAPGGHAGHGLLAPEQAAVGEVLRAARAAFSLVVVDVGRSPACLELWATACDAVAVLVPGRRPAVAAARCLLAEVPTTPSGILVRGPLPDGVDAPMVADAVGAPWLGTMPVLRDAAGQLAAGRAGELAHRRRMRRVTDALLDWVEGPGLSGIGLTGAGPAGIGLSGVGRGRS